jgi:hypothetical protein
MPQPESVCQDGFASYSEQPLPGGPQLGAQAGLTSNVMLNGVGS